MASELALVLHGTRPRLRADVGERESGFSRICRRTPSFGSVRNDLAWLHLSSSGSSVSSRANSSDEEMSPRWALPQSSSLVAGSGSSSPRGESEWEASAFLSRRCHTLEQENFELRMALTTLRQTMTDYRYPACPEEGQSFAGSAGDLANLRLQIAQLEDQVARERKVHQDDILRLRGELRATSAEVHPLMASPALCTSKHLHGKHGLHRASSMTSLLRPSDCGRVLDMGSGASEATECAEEEVDLEETGDDEDTDDSSYMHTETPMDTFYSPCDQSRSEVCVSIPAPSAGVGTPGFPDSILEFPRESEEGNLPLREPTFDADGSLAELSEQLKDVPRLHIPSDDDACLHALVALTRPRRHSSDCETFISARSSPANQSDAVVDCRRICVPQEPEMDLDASLDIKASGGVHVHLESSLDETGGIAVWAALSRARSDSGHDREAQRPHSSSPLRPGSRTRPGSPRAKPQSPRTKQWSPPVRQPRRSTESSPQSEPCDAQTDRSWSRFAAPRTKSEATRLAKNGKEMKAGSVNLPIRSGSGSTPLKRLSTGSCHGNLGSMIASPLASASCATSPLSARQRQFSNSSSHGSRFMRLPLGERQASSNAAAPVRNMVQPNTIRMASAPGQHLGRGRH
uniref:Uncharacterized protein n=1 Tax=Noctiluca scintillans TaxID=2966 RepID=A0A7S1ANH5_NOCSC